MSTPGTGLFSEHVKTTTQARVAVKSVFFVKSRKVLFFRPKQAYNQRGITKSAKKYTFSPKSRFRASQSSTFDAKSDFFITFSVVWHGKWPKNAAPPSVRAKSGDFSILTAIGDFYPLRETAFTSALALVNANCMTATAVMQQ